MIDIIMSCFFPNNETGLARYEYARKAVAGLRRHLECGEPINYIFAMDNEPNDITNSFERMVNRQVVYGPNHGLGASLNRALRFARGDKWMYTTDDWVLTQALDLDKAIQLIGLGYDYVRLGPLHPNLAAIVKFSVDTGWFLELNWDNGGFVAAERPFIMTKRLTEELAKAMHYSNLQGTFVEHVDAYVMEKVFNRTMDFLAQSTFFDLKVAALLSDSREWMHIGEVEVGDLQPIGS